jgi:hypothetical protein
MTKPDKLAYLLAATPLPGLQTRLRHPPHGTILSDNFCCHDHSTAPPVEQPELSLRPFAAVTAQIGVDLRRLDWQTTQADAALRRCAGRTTQMAGRFTPVRPANGAGTAGFYVEIRKPQILINAVRRN